MLINMRDTFGGWILAIETMKKVYIHIRPISFN